MMELRSTRILPRALAGALAATALWMAAASAQAPAPAPATLTDAQIGRLRNIAIDKGSAMPVPPPLATVLRFTPAQVTPVVRQVSFQGDDGVKHGFAHLNDDSGYLFFRRSPAGAWAFHTDRNLQLVMGAHTFSAQQFIALPEASARDELAAEMGAWSRVLSAQGAPAPAPAGGLPAGVGALPISPRPGPATGAAPAPSQTRP